MTPLHINPWTQLKLLREERQKRNQSMFLYERNGIKIYKAAYAQNYGKAINDLEGVLK